MGHSHWRTSRILQGKYRVPESAPILFCDWPSLNVALVVICAAITGYDIRASVAGDCFLLPPNGERHGEGSSLWPIESFGAPEQSGKAAPKLRLTKLNT
jgi:hypothetical protein